MAVLDAYDFTGRVLFCADVIRRNEGITIDFRRCFVHGDNEYLSAALLDLSQTDSKILENLHLYFNVDALRDHVNALTYADRETGARIARRAFESPWNGRSSFYYWD